jgi:hypothetical protein
MDWLERWFDLSPDAGDGSVELRIFIVLGFAIVGFLWKFKRSRHQIALAGAIVTFSRAAWKRGTRWAGADFASARRSTRPGGGTLLDSPGK